MVVFNSMWMFKTYRMLLILWYICVLCLILLHVFGYTNGRWIFLFNVLMACFNIWWVTKNLKKYKIDAEEEVLKGI